MPDPSPPSKGVISATCLRVGVWMGAGVGLGTSRQLTWPSAATSETSRRPSERSGYAAGVKR